MEKYLLQQLNCSLEEYNKAYQNIKNVSKNIVEFFYFNIFLPTAFSTSIDINKEFFIQMKNTIETMPFIDEIKQKSKMIDIFPKLFNINKTYNELKEKEIEKIFFSIEHVYSTDYLEKTIKIKFAQNKNNQNIDLNLYNFKPLIDLLYPINSNSRSFFNFLNQQQNSKDLIRIDICEETFSNYKQHLLKVSYNNEEISQFQKDYFEKIINNSTKNKKTLI